MRFYVENIWNFVHYPYQGILGTLIAHLPNESKDLLYMNRIFISTPTSKQTLLNYISFIKVLSIHKIDQIIKKVLKNQQIYTSNNKYLVSRIIKSFYESN